MDLSSIEFAPEHPAGTGLTPRVVTFKYPDMDISQFPSKLSAGDSRLSPYVVNIKFDADLSMGGGLVIQCRSEASHYDSPVSFFFSIDEELGSRCQAGDASGLSATEWHEKKAEWATVIIEIPALGHSDSSHVITLSSDILFGFAEIEFDYLKLYQKHVQGKCRSRTEYR